MSAVSPSHVLTGNASYAFQIEGESLAVVDYDNERHAPDTLTIGGLACPDIEVVSHELILCRGLTGLDGWLSNGIAVELAAQTFLS